MIVDGQGFESLYVFPNTIIGLTVQEKLTNS